MELEESPWTTTFWDLASCLQERQVLCDLRIGAENEDGTTKYFSVHRLILSCASKFLMAKMVQNKLEDHYFFEDVSPNGLQGLIRYVYGQDVSGNQADYREYLQAAKVLMVPNAEKVFQTLLKKTKADAGISPGSTMPSNVMLNTESNSPSKRKKNKSETSNILKAEEAGESLTKNDVSGTSSSEKWKSVTNRDHEASAENISEMIHDMGMIEPGPGRRVRKTKFVSPGKPPVHVCTICNTEFPRKHHLLKHQKTVHAMGKEYKCEHCDKSYHFKTQYNYHVRTHTNEKPYLCSICGKGFAIPSTLKLHMEIHKPETDKKFQCSHCGKKFAQKGNMDRHILGRHTSDKIFQCDICGKSFHWYKSLIDHRKRHDGPTPKLFKCTKCDFAFDTRYKLERHMVVHSSVKPYVCDWCGQRFTQGGSMNKHKKDSCKMRPGEMASHLLLL